MEIKIEIEDHSYPAIDTYEVWTKVKDFITDYNISQTIFGNRLGYTFRLNKIEQTVKPWHQLNSLQREKFRKLKMFIENPKMIEMLKKGKISYKDAGLDKNKISTQEISQKVINELKKNNIRLRMFTKKVLGLVSEQAVQNYLLSPKSWEELNEQSSRSFLKMFVWLNDANRLDIFKRDDNQNNSYEELDSDGSEMKKDIKYGLVNYQLKQSKVIIERLNLESKINKINEACTQLIVRNEPVMRSKLQNETKKSDGEKKRKEEIFQENRTFLLEKIKKIEQESKSVQQNLKQINDNLKNELKEMKKQINDLKFNQENSQLNEIIDLKTQLDEQKEKNRVITYKSQNLENDNQNIKTLIDQMLFQQRQLQQTQFSQQQQYNNLYMQFQIPFQIPIQLQPINDNILSVSQ